MADHSIVSDDRSVSTEDIDALSDASLQQELRDYKEERRAAEREAAAAAAEELGDDKDDDANLDELGCDDDTEALIEESKRPRRKIALPVFAQEVNDGEGTIAFKLENMPTETRVKVELVLQMYAEQPTHFKKITAPIDLVAEMIPDLGKHKIAFFRKPAAIAKWDWTKKLPKVGRVDYDERCLMEGLYHGIDDNRINNPKIASLPRLKGWDHYLKLWKEGRQLYSNYQYLMPGSSFEEIEAKIIEEVGSFKTKIRIDEHMAKKLREFREDKMKEARAKEIAAASGSVAAAATTTATTTTTAATTSTTAASTKGTTAASTKGTTTTGTRRSTRLNPAVPTVPVTPATSAKKSAPVVPPTIARRSARQCHPLPTKNSSAKTSTPTPAKAPAATLFVPPPPSTKRRRTLSFTGIEAKRPKLACGETSGTSTMLGPPKYMEDGKGNAGYTDPTDAWVEEQMHKMTVLKHFGNLCADKGISGTRAEVDSAIEAMMGGAAAYDRTFMLLLTYAIAEHMTENDEALLKILDVLKAANAITPAAIAQLGARGLKKIIAPHDNGINTAWLVQMCNVLVNEHGGKVPSKIEEILAMGIAQITTGVATAVCQDAFGWYYGPVVDYYYGVRMAIALDLLHLTPYGDDKFEIDPDRVDPDQVRESLMTWLPTRDWKNFHKLMVSTVQIIIETDDVMARKEELQNIIRKHFVTNDKNLLFGVIEDVHKRFLVEDEEAEEDT